MTKRFANGRRYDKGSIASWRKGYCVSLVGKNIDAFCSRCDFTLAHIVLYDMEVLFREGRKRMAMNRPEADR
jgi:hypothetical protein